jgi:molybdenum cofactor cytidylyltransferase
MGISAVILAAGMASRMGTQKQLLQLGTKTLLEHVLWNVEASHVSEIIVVLGSAAETVRAQIAPASKVRIVVNEDFQSGMGSSLQRGLSEISVESAAVLVVLADQPLVKPATINLLIDEYQRHKSQILIPLYRGFRGNPVLLDRSVFPEVMGLSGDIGCRAIFGDHLENIRKIAVDDAGVLLDADRPEDLAELERIYAAGEFALPVMERAEAFDASRPEVLIVGRESVARAIAKFARLLDWQVTMVDPLLKFADMPEACAILRELDFTKLPPAERRFCVVASMGRFDEEAIEQALAVDIPYIALVANKKRSQEVLQSLGLRGFFADRLAGVRTKPGLSIGAQTPAEIALSIVAEVVKEMRQPPG